MFLLDILLPSVSCLPAKLCEPVVVTVCEQVELRAVSCSIFCTKGAVLYEDGIKIQLGVYRKVNDNAPVQSV